MLAQPVKLTLQKSVPQWFYSLQYIRVIQFYIYKCRTSLITHTKQLSTPLCSLVMTISCQLIRPVVGNKIARVLKSLRVKASVAAARGLIWSTHRLFSGALIATLGILRKVTLVSLRFRFICPLSKIFWSLILSLLFQCPNAEIQSDCSFAIVSSHLSF